MTQRNLASTRIARRVAPFALLLALCLVWQVTVSLLDVPALILPTPVRVGQELIAQRAGLWSATLLTAAASALGFLISMTLGSLVAMVFSQSPWIRSGFYPYAIFLQTVPIVAIAPIIVVWLGEGFLAVVVISTIVSLFPVITNGTEGMTSVPQGLQELFAMNGATRWQTLWKLQLPGAIPSLVTAAKIASGAAVLGAIVGEFFVGVGVESPGLGFLISVAKDRFNMAYLFAAVLASTLLGIIMFGFVSYVSERFLLHWTERRIHER